MRLAFCDQIVLGIVLFAHRNKRMTSFRTKVRHVNNASGIIGDQRDLFTARQLLHPLAQAQDGQGAQKAAGINILAHEGHVGTMFQPVHNLVTDCADDAALAMG